MDTAKAKLVAGLQVFRFSPIMAHREIKDKRNEGNPIIFINQS